MKNKIIILVCIMAGTIGGLQAGNRKADRYFELFRYSKAIPLYKKAAETKTGQEKREATEKLADCYRLTGDIREARLWYAKAVKYENPDPVLFYYYGQALQGVSQYKEAQKAFLEYSRLKPGDNTGKIMADFCDRIQSLPTLPPTVKVENASVLNSSGSEFAPAYFRDGLVFASDRQTDLLDGHIYDWTSRGFLDIYFSSIQAADDSWEAMTEPVKMDKEFNQLYHDGPACFSGDYSEVFLTRTDKEKVKKDQNNIRTNLLQLYTASLTGTGKPGYKLLPFNSDDISTGHATLSPDGSFLIFSSDRPGGSGAGDLWYAGRSGETWGDPVNLGTAVNSFGNELFPFMADDTTLVFSSDGHLGYGGLDLYLSKLRNGQWTEPRNMLKPVNSPFDDFALVFRKGTNNGFFSSNRPGGAGSDDIYALRDYSVETGAKETIPVAPVQMVSGLVKDKRTGIPLSQATVFVLNSFTNEVSILKTNANGLYEMKVDKGILYVAKAMMPDYLDDCLNFRFSDTDTSTDLTAPRDLLLDKFSVNQVFKLENIYYDLDKWFIREDAKPALDDLVRNLKQFPITIELASHTDSRAPDEYNMILSQKRAQAAVQYLTMNGIDRDRLTAKGYGETMLVNGCKNGVQCPEEEHQANRRTEFRILSVDSPVKQSGGFDPSLFVAGDVIPVQLLEAGFFSGCLQNAEKTVSGKQPAAVPSPPVMGKPVQKPETGIVQNRKNIETAEPVTTDDNANSWFTVQIYAVTSLSESRKLDLMGENAYSKPVDKYTKYFVGRFSDWRAANRERLRLNNKFPGCFVVAFKDGKVVPVSELRKILEQ